MKKFRTPNDKPKLRRTKATRVQHAVYARQSDARKRDGGLTKVYIWLPHEHADAFREMAKSVMAKHLVPPPAPVFTPKPAKQVARLKRAADQRQGSLPF